MYVCWRGNSRHRSLWATYCSRGGPSVVYQEKTKYCNKKDSGASGHCIFIGPITGFFEGDGAYYQNGTHGDTTLLNTRGLDVADTIKDPMNKVFDQYPDLKQWIKKYIDDHKHCQFQVKSGGIEYTMTCSHSS
ncbi:hypothetical protein MHLP_00395 [Candidatus Mycoplasma haematolamae str. Purdue]|uniref:Uncharacterized protein n=1 Tax=Mycoplasma haematolamae (strain Purdue) TaxID=1212765 RepID=I7CIH4_MYCHA|nr:hypothetical protein MHLP_00395 [Candidatus Mycoplasma haematolamae str. Purdue]